MIWINEAVHVARKDIRHARTALLVYSVVVLIALTFALMMPVHAEDTTWLTASVLLLMLFGVILSAAAVQADSPTQSSAFWASRPFHPTAMLGAKVVFCAAVIIGVPLVAELIGLLQFQTPVSTLAADLLRSAGIYGLVLLATIVIASLTPDLRGFIVGALVVFIGLILLVAATTFSDLKLFSAGDSVTAAFVSTWATRAIALGGSVALLVWLYRRRDVSRAAWIGAVMVVGACIGLLMEVSASRILPIASATPVDSVAVLIDHASLGGGRAVGAPVLDLRLSVPNPRPMHRVAVLLRDVTVRLKDGSSVKTEPMWEELPFDDPTSMLPQGVQAFDPRVGPTASIAASLAFRPEDRDRVMKVGISAVDVQGSANVSVARRLITGTFGDSRTRTTGGTRIDIGRGRNPSSPYSLEVLAASVDNTRSLTNEPISVVIVNERLRRGLILNSQQYGGGSSSWMVLPGAPLWQSRVVFNSLRPNAATGRMMAVGPVGFTATAVEETVDAEPDSAWRRRFPDAAWYDGAKISVLQWSQRSWQQVHLTKTAD